MADISEATMYGTLLMRRGGSESFGSSWIGTGIIPRSRRANTRVIHFNIQKMDFNTVQAKVQPFCMLRAIAAARLQILAT